ncbi:MAG TPA: class I SAM-dependent methyltransferase [Bacteroidia bacterium]|nr:class I SAM-dependent methyltransferase [Bacteroidia bacterium]HNT80058.1 class I SAM-dependent methyltransferase [Bacteroidia bacterium]
MVAEEFFDLLLEEIRENKDLRGYYRFLDNEKLFHFRKSYYVQRLAYLYDQLKNTNEAYVWDCGCGYGSTGIFLALNGIRSHGTTLEYYFHQISSRLNYWKKIGDISKFSYSYENVFDTQIKSDSYDAIIVQDTLHHLEPLQDALNIFSRSLKKDGRIIAIEENGSNVIQNTKLFLQRGNKKIIKVYDENLGKEYLMGNENIRSLSKWRDEFSDAGFKIDNETIHYVRLFPPFMMNEINTEKRVKQEQNIWKKNRMLRNYFFFGLNFVATKK